MSGNASRTAFSMSGSRGDDVRSMPSESPKELSLIPQLVLAAMTPKHGGAASPMKTGGPLTLDVSAHVLSTTGSPRSFDATSVRVLPLPVVVPVPMDSSMEDDGDADFTREITAQASDLLLLSLSASNTGLRKFTAGSGAGSGDLSGTAGGAPHPTPAVASSASSSTDRAAAAHRRELVKQTWARVAAVSGAPGDAFFAALFAAHKAVIPLVATRAHADEIAAPPGPEGPSSGKNSLRHQARALVAALTDIVAKLDDPAGVRPLLHKLGQRHRGHGVTEDHFTIVGRILLATLRSALGDELTPAAEDAWAATYELITQGMLVGIRGGASADADAESRLQQSLDYLGLFVDEDGDGMRARLGPAFGLEKPPAH